MASYTQAQVAEALQTNLIEEIDVAGGPLPIVDVYGTEQAAQITDVSTDEIDTIGHMSDFEVRTSDGRTFRVRVTEVHRTKF